ncbi:hypothetical protein IE4872_PD01433 (plasmid) [Rhizobium gallicum]|uniref:Uncharacterized protein n=1 Tax=Rhizobium gallicum TaxID=56730 RepID=A0A1L5NVN4_9HYPH|nr:hypothetical protein IE4872_PD01433 [Rhizobium gallicum]
MLGSVRESSTTVDTQCQWIEIDAGFPWCKSESCLQTTDSEMMRLPLTTIFILALPVSEAARSWRGAQTSFRAG